MSFAGHEADMRATKCAACVAMCVGVATVALFGAIATWDSTSALAASSFSLGKYWEPGSSADGARVETRPSAQAFGSAMASIGYGNTTDLDGTTATEGWLNAANANVLGIFAHANENIVVLQDPTPGTNLYKTGHIHSDKTGLNMPDAPDHERGWWPEFQPDLVDDLKVVVFGGCHTALLDTGWPQSMQMLGVDSYVGFRESIYYPEEPGGTYSGSYYWSRFSSYAQAGYTVRDSLSLARADLFAAEGNNGGYESWAVAGAGEDPGAVRFTPASAGKLNIFGWNFIPQPPVATERLSLESLTTTRSQVMKTHDGEFVDHETAEMASYRLDDRGALVNWIAPATNTGAVALSEADAVAAASNFAAKNVTWFDTGDMTAPSTNPTAHSRGESLLAVEWRRSTAGGGAGPAVARAEVDLRTGYVVGFTAQRVASDQAAFSVTREEAVAAARSATGIESGVVELAARDRWRGPRWIIRLGRGESVLGTPAKSIAIVDGQTGEVTTTAATA